MVGVRAMLPLGLGIEFVLRVRIKAWISFKTVVNVRSSMWICMRARV